MANNSNIQISNNSALESLLKITNVLKESLGVSEKSTSSDESAKYQRNSVLSYSSHSIISQPKTISYNYGSYTIVLNKTVKSYIISYAPKTSSYFKQIEIPVIVKKTSYGAPVSYVQPKIEDLLTKGKLTFEKKIVVSYSYSYNLQNIIPNPLYNKYINDKYNNDLYATGDLDGESNTTYLKLNKNNISNQISKDYYIPSIGELGISMENIQKINDSIDALGSEYSDYKIPYNSIVASSSLYSQQKIMNSEYNVTNNINNVWCFNNNNAEISYRAISNKYTIIPFYKFENNIKINLDEDIEDIVVNSIVTIEKYDPNMYYEQNLPISNYQTMIKNISDFNIDNWLESPFNPKYFFNISFPEVKNYLKEGDNFIKLHDNYLSYYEYYGYYIQYGRKNNQPTISLDVRYNSDTNSYSYYMDIENNEECRKNLIWNNGVAYSEKLIKNYEYVSFIDPYNHNTTLAPGSDQTYDSKWISDNELISYIYTYFSKEQCIGPNNMPIHPREYFTSYISYTLQTNYNDYWKQLLIYNVPIYNNHIVLTPIYGSGEQIYNFKKNKAKSVFYVTLPSVCTKFECKMNNTTDCNISISKYLEVYGLTIYCITLDFNVDVPTDNVLIFNCYYLGKQITKKYFYTIYSLLISNGLYNNSNYTTYFDIENYYVAKDPYYWWEINKWSYLPNKNDYYTYRYQNSSILNTNCFMIKRTIKDQFGKLFDDSFEIISNQFVAYNANNTDDYWLATIPHDYTFNSYTYNKYHSAFIKLANTYFNGMYDISYLINTISRNIGIKDNGTGQDRGLRVERMIDNDIFDNSQIYDIERDDNHNYLIKDHELNIPFISSYSYIYYEPKYELKYSDQNRTFVGTNSMSNYILKNNYHMFSINTYLNNPNEYKHSNIKYLSYTYYNSLVFYKPIIRINRNIDDFGIYNDLIFAYIPKYYNGDSYFPSNYEIDGTISVDNLTYYNKSANQYEKKPIVLRKNKNGRSENYSLTIKFNGSENITKYPENKTPYLYKLPIKYYYEPILGDTSWAYYNKEYSSDFEFNNKIKINIPIVGAKQSICLANDMVEYINIGLFRKVITNQYGRIYSKGTGYNYTHVLAKSENTINYKIYGIKYNDKYFYEKGFDECINIEDINQINGEDKYEIARAQSSGWYYTLRPFNQLFHTEVPINDHFGQTERPNNIDIEEINNEETDNEETDNDRIASIYNHMRIDYNDSFLFDYTYYYNYIFSDYLFLYNNTNTVVTLLISDPSLTLINKQYAQIQLKPYELKVYYPSNFNYNDTNNFDRTKIYTLKIINKTDSIFNMKFEHYKLGEYNLSFDEMYDAFVNDNIDVIEYINNHRFLEHNDKPPKMRLNGTIPDQIGYKMVTNLLGMCKNYDDNNPYTKNKILTLYYNILLYKNSGKTINDYYSDLNKCIHNKLMDNDINILSSYINTLNIDIKNYSENKAGHLIIIESDKKFTRQSDKKFTRQLSKSGQIISESNLVDNINIDIEKINNEETDNDRIALSGDNK